MTKNLFLLFSLYFFVGQSLIIGFLRKETSFYRLAVINAIAILLISIVYAFCTRETSPKKEKKSPNKVSIEQEVIQETNNPKETVFTEKISIQKVVQTTPAPIEKKKKKRNSTRGAWIIFFISLIIGACAYFILREFFLHWAGILAIIIGLVCFVIIGKIIGTNGFDRVNTLGASKLYYIIGIVALAYALVFSYGSDKLINTINQYIPNVHTLSKITTPDQDQEENDPNIGTGEYIFESTGEVLSGFNTLEENENLGIGGTSIPEIETNTGNSNEEIEVSTTEITNITMADALKHVIENYNIPLSTKTDISFTYVGKSNENYPYFKTAYEKRMIGKSTEPNKQISCETYTVIKGLAAGWDVGSYTDIKAAYREKAEELNVLNGCKKGGYVTTDTL
ncbi:MAG: hypothetical protein PHU61_01890 [Candidatus Absconditabacteria bacterium]|nr:hypothetical protein [Candidatus Absconditabacteria bacterium]MDD3868461.1 hypothetical protein [Candidatus Absconditabacteria bacterium]MDD4713965.1 hypothetical protein [Candidatus Absconditabacteria bacterium]